MDLWTLAAYDAIIINWRASFPRALPLDPAKGTNVPLETRALVWIKGSDMPCADRGPKPRTTQMRNMRGIMNVYRRFGHFLSIINASGSDPRILMTSCEQGWAPVRATENI